MGALLLPHQPPLCSADLPTVGGRPGAEPEDFVVDEIPLYPASGKGEHWFVRVRKRLRTTPDMIEAVARAAGVSARDVGYAGMKDKQAVTTQWISVPAGCHRVEAWALPLGIEVLETARHDNKLRTGHLLANHFRIRLVGVQDEPLPRARAILHRLTERGLPNYFGAQRFGRDGSNLSLAVEWLLNGGQNKRGKRGRFYAKLYPSVIQAEVFNRYLSARLERGGDRLLE
ncbi:MAG TPA: tRNA pseudouridine(13) synthase TruD, partial [Polyangiaceae bacterium]